MKTLYILAFTVIGIAITSCSKDKRLNNSRTTKYFYLSEGIKQFKFEAGSYWIYQNDANSAIDSVVVTSTENGFFSSTPPVHGNSGSKSEFYKMNLKSFATDLTYNHYLTEYSLKRNGGGEYGEDGQPILVNNMDTLEVFYGLKTIAKLPTMTINGYTFNNVTETKIIASQQHLQTFQNDTYLYFTASVGLIKKVTDLGNGNFETWSIKRWKTLK